MPLDPDFEIDDTEWYECARLPAESHVQVSTPRRDFVERFGHRSRTSLSQATESGCRGATMFGT